MFAANRPSATRGKRSQDFSRRTWTVSPSVPVSWKNVLSRPASRAARRSAPLHRTKLFVAAPCALSEICYGSSQHFAGPTATDTGETIWRENRWCTAPYFSPALVRRPQAFRLPAKKTPGTYRIFVLGSSAAMGDPEAAFSFGRVLETMLHA